MGPTVGYRKHLQLQKLILNTADVKEEHIIITYILKNHCTTAKHIKICGSIFIYV